MFTRPTETSLKMTNSTDFELGVVMTTHVVIWNRPHVHYITNATTTKWSEWLRMQFIWWAITPTLYICLAMLPCHKYIHVVSSCVFCPHISDVMCVETIGSCRMLNNSFLDARGLSQRRPANIFSVTIQIRLKKHRGLTKLTAKLINHHVVCVCVRQERVQEVHPKRCVKIVLVNLW